MSNRKEKFIAELSKSRDESDIRELRRGADKRGHTAEWLCRAWLRLKGYGVLEARFKTAVGEIDIIAKQGKTIVFIEVKAHKSVEASLRSVTPKQQRRILKAARWFTSAQPGYANNPMRFDVMVVNGMRIHHLKNAFGESHG